MKNLEYHLWEQDTCRQYAKTIIYGFIVLVATLSLVSVAYAQEEAAIETPSLETYGLAIAVFITAGLAYTGIGYWDKVKRYLSGDPSATFDKRKMGKTLVLGILLGFGAYIAEETANGIHPVPLHTPHDFLAQVGLTWGMIYAFDKIVLSGRGGTKVTAGSAPSAGAPKRSNAHIPPDGILQMPNIEDPKPDPDALLAGLDDLDLDKGPQYDSLPPKKETDL